MAAEMGHYNFILGQLQEAGVMSERLQQVAQETGRQVGTYALFTVVMGETDQQAQKLAQHYMEGGDIEALLGWKGAADTDPVGVNVKKYQAEAFMGIPTIIGSYETVAAQLDQIATHTSIDGILFTFPDFVEDVALFGERVMPLLRCRHGSEIPC